MNIMKSLPQNEYVVYIDNFFTSTKLLRALKSQGIAACGTAKLGSGIPLELLELKLAWKKATNWGEIIYTTDKVPEV